MYVNDDGILVHTSSRPRCPRCSEIVTDPDAGIQIGFYTYHAVCFLRRDRTLREAYQRRMRITEP